jgi:hypothetical protein
MIRLLAVLVGCLCSAQARTIAVGLFSFDVLIPGDPPAPGVNVFAVSNLTGGFGLPPDFPVATGVGLLDAQVRLSNGVVRDLGLVSPGVLLPEELQFPETEVFSTAFFSAELTPTTFILSDGTTFTAASRRVSVELRPKGGILQAGSDFQLITVSDVPEPGNFWLAFACVSAIACSRQRSGRKRD